MIPSCLGGGFWKTGLWPSHFLKFFFEFSKFQLQQLNPFLHAFGWLNQKKKIPSQKRNIMLLETFVLLME